MSFSRFIYDFKIIYLFFIIKKYFIIKYSKYLSPHLKEESIEVESNELMNETKELMNDEDEYDTRPEESFDKIIVGVCAMAKKVNSKPMEAILSRLKSYDHFDIIVFTQETILDSPIENWPRCDCFLSFYSKDFPLKKAQEYAKLFNPYLINDLEKQWDIMDRTKVFMCVELILIRLSELSFIVT